MLVDYQTSCSIMMHYKAITLCCGLFLICAIINIHIYYKFVLTIINLLAVTFMLQPFLYIEIMYITMLRACYIDNVTTFEPH